MCPLVCVALQCVCVSVCVRHRGCVCVQGGEKTARLRLLLETARARPGYASTQPAPEFYVAAYFSYAGGAL